VRVGVRVQRRGQARDFQQRSDETERDRVPHRRSLTGTGVSTLVTAFSSQA
jgi:hypothetical protein